MQFQEPCMVLGGTVDMLSRDHTWSIAICATSLQGRHASKQADVLS